MSADFHLNNIPNFLCLAVIVHGLRVCTDTSSRVNVVSTWRGVSIRVVNEISRKFVQYSEALFCFFFLTVLLCVFVLNCADKLPGGIALSKY